MHALHHTNAPSLAKCMHCITQTHPPLQEMHHYSMQMHLTCKNTCFIACKCICPAKCMHCIIQMHPPLQNACTASHKHILPCKKCIITACKCICPAKCKHCITQTPPPLQNACTASRKLILPCKKCMHHSMQTHLSCKTHALHHADASSLARNACITACKCTCPAKMHAL